MVFIVNSNFNAILVPIYMPKMANRVQYLEDIGNSIPAVTPAILPTHTHTKAPSGCIY